MNNFFGKLLYHSPVAIGVVFGPLIVFCILPQLNLGETCEEQRRFCLIIYLPLLSEELHDEIHSVLLIEEVAVQLTVVVYSSMAQLVACVPVVENRAEMSIVLQSKSVFHIKLTFLEFIPGETDGFFWPGDS